MPPVARATSHTVQTLPAAYTMRLLTSATLPRSTAASTSVHSSQNAQATTSIPSRMSGGALGSHLQPSDMLSYLNSGDFSAFRSSSDPSRPLFGDDEALASSALTHESWMHGMQGHNRRLAFLGRRALKTYLSLLFFDILEHAKRTGASGADLAYVQNVLSSQHHIDDILSTHHLGDSVGRELGIEKYMRWHPRMHVDGNASAQESGLYKVRGSCVEAVLGAIYHYRGALVAEQFFYSRILPALATSYMSQAPALVHEKLKEKSRQATESLANAA